MAAEFKKNFQLVDEDDDSLSWRLDRHISFSYSLSDESEENYERDISISARLSIFVRCWKDEHMYDVYYELPVGPHKLQRKMHSGHVTETEVDDLIGSVQKDVVDTVLFGMKF